MSALERRQRRPPLVVEREYQSDRARCVAGVAMVLAWAAERRARRADPSLTPTTDITTGRASTAPPAAAPPGAGHENARVPPRAKKGHDPHDPEDRAPL